MTTFAADKQRFPIGATVKYRYSGRTWIVERYCRQADHGPCIVLENNRFHDGPGQHMTTDGMVDVGDISTYSSEGETLESFKKKVQEFFVQIQQERPRVQDWCDELWTEYVTPRLGIEKPAPKTRRYTLTIVLPDIPNTAQNNYDPSEFQQDGKLNIDFFKNAIEDYGPWAHTVMANAETILEVNNEE